MEVSYTNAAYRSLKKLPPQDRKALMEKIETYAKTGDGDVVFMVGSKNSYRIRHGKWRAIFEMEDDILVVKIAKRGEIYKRKR